MKILYHNQAQSGFVKTHQDCLCGEHRGCFSEREDGSGLCHSCGKNFPANNRTTTYTPPQRPIQPAREAQTVPDSNIHPSMFGVAQSPFVRTFKRITRAELHGYIGANGNDVLFWYRDSTGVVRNAKRIRYQANGFNRDKTVEPKMLYTSANGFITPFWGEEYLQHYATLPNTDIFIVESEKTALYAQTQFRRYLWLASGGANGCTVSKIERIKHLLLRKRLFMLFDNDSGGENGTNTAITNFKRCELSASALSVSDVFPNAPTGCDLADAIVLAKGVTL